MHLSRPPGRSEIYYFAEGRLKLRDIEDGVDCLKQHKSTPWADTDLTSSSVAMCSCDSSCSQTWVWLGSSWALYGIRLSAGFDYMLRSSARDSSIPAVGTDMPPVTCPGLHPGKLCKEKRWTRIFREALDHLSSHKNSIHIWQDLANFPFF